MDQQPWHRLFGLSWTDFFRGLPVTVEIEKDLSLKQQLLDVVLIRTEGGIINCRLPDGFEELAPHNLVSFKSYQEALDGWALNELVGHYVNYRKQASPTMQDLLPETDFRLFAVSVRYPQNLARQTTLTPIKAGVYTLRHYTGIVQVVVIHELPQVEHNAMLHLFSAQMEQVRYGVEHYRIQSSETSTLLNQLFERYRLEAQLMPDALQELHRQTVDKILRETPPEKLLELLSTKQRLQGLPPEDRLEGLSPEKRLEGLPPEKRLEGLPPEARLAGLTREQLLELQEALARRLKNNGETEQAT